MKAVRDNRGDGRSISLQQQRFQREEFRACLRALLMTPLMSPAHEDFAAVRRQPKLCGNGFRARRAGRCRSSARARASSSIPEP
ncbi:hypothetical protein MPL3356_340145 [Mesorhizobium plurifarium]|uniref:Uncharacterized protein n=1 Tax=Mesorhizobium plurifarium TaxID=69974 RepID=A0A090E1R4_MESPL|nr:hypothetical protein MPL3356_340145 [Mesorhizobium plurifarium]